LLQWVGGASSSRDGSIISPQLHSFHNNSSFLYLTANRARGVLCPESNSIIGRTKNTA
jgi:hypothetical protein